MFRRHNQILLTLLILLDLSVVLGTWNLAYWLRFYAINLPPAQVFRVTPASLQPVLAQGLPPEAAQRMLGVLAPAYTSTFVLRRDVNDVLAPAGLGRYAAAVVDQAASQAVVPPYEQYARVNTFLFVMAVLVFYSMGVYSTRRFRSLRTELEAAWRAMLVLILLAMAASFMYRGYEYSRVQVAYYAACLLAGITLERGLARWVMGRLRRQGWLVRRFILVGDSPLAAQFYRRWLTHQDRGLQCLGLVTPQPARRTPELAGLRHLGTVADLPALLESLPVDEVIAALTMDQHPHLEALHAALANHYVDYRVIPDLGSSLSLRTEVENFDGLPVITLSQGPLEGWNQVFKRIFDLAGSVAALLVFSPLLLLIPVLIKLTSPGPVLYVQERMGWNGKTFRMLKFRSMAADAEARTGPVWASEGDRRRTGLGTWLRKTNLDELPQLINVLKGDMSLVGPRPERPVFIQHFRHQVPNYMLRHKIKAGMTGWAQVNGWRGNTSLEKRIEFDLFYISNWSIGFDFRILFLTLARGFFHRHAY